MPATPEPRVAFLTPIEARALIDAAAPHLRPLIVFLIGTGARMSEALELDWRDVDLAAGRATFSRTKGRRPGGGRIRRIDLYPAVRAALAALPHRDGRVFRPVYRVKRDADNRDGLVTGDAYRDSGRHGGGQIKRAWSGACRRAGLGEVVDGRFVARVRPHDLRHTAATWHYAMHRDLLALQQWGGWASVKLVQVYAHLLPDFYAAEVRALLGLTAPGERKRRAKSVQSDYSRQLAN